AIEMLRAGYAKVYVPAAAVLHSHTYGPLGQLRLSFDESRALREVYGFREPLGPLRLAGQLRGGLGETRRELDRHGAPPFERVRALAAAGLSRSMRLAGAILGS